MVFGSRLLCRITPSLKSIRHYRAAVLHEYNSEVEINTLKDRSPADHEILIKTETAGVNHADLMMYKGNYHLKPPLPFTLGT